MGLAYGDSRDNVAEGPGRLPQKWKALLKRRDFSSLLPDPSRFLFPVVSTAGLQTHQLLASAGPLACPSLASLSPARKEVL